MKEIDFIYMAQPPKKWTLEQPKLKKWVEDRFKGKKTLNLFAGKTKLNLDEVRVDISDEWNPDIISDAFDYVKNNDLTQFEAILLDPPYNLRKAREKYGDKYIGSYTKIKNVIAEKVKIGTLIITMGYDSVGMAKCRGFDKKEICLICHGGDHNDTICLVEQKMISNTMNEEY